MDIMKAIVLKHKIVAILRNVPEKELQAAGADFVAVGGVSLKNAAEYLKNGFVGVGIGSSLVKEELFLQKKWELISTDIKEQLDVLKKEGLF